MRIEDFSEKKLGTQNGGKWGITEINYIGTIGKGVHDVIYRVQLCREIEQKHSNFYGVLSLI